MSGNDFDWGAIDPSITKTSQGMQVTAPIVSVPSTNEFKDTDPALSAAFQQADDAWFAKTGQHIPVTSAARSREKQKEIFDRAKKGEKGIYMPINPDEHPEKEMFHTDALDIPENIPESFLNQFGIHRPLGKSDPVHAKLMPTAKEAETPSSDFNWSSVMGNNEAKANENEQSSITGKNIVPKGALESATSGIYTGAINSMIGVPQIVSNAALGTQAAPSKWLNEQATALEKENEPYRLEHPNWNVGGQIVGAMPSAMIPVGDIEAGSSLLSQAGQGAKGGLVGGLMQGVPDTTNPIEYWLKKGEQAVGGAIGGAITAPIVYGATKLLGKSIDTAANAWDWMKNRNNPVTATAVPAVEAAAKAGISEEGQKIVASAPANIQQKIIEDVNAGKVLDETAIGLHAKDQSLFAPLKLTDAQAKKDAFGVSEERNNKTENGFQEHQAHQDLQARANLDHFISEFSPDVKGDTGHFSTAEKQIESLDKKATSLKESITSAYQKVKDLNGGNFPINVNELNSNINNSLQSETGRLRTYQKENGPLSDIKKDIDDSIKNGNMSFETYETLRSDLAGIMRINSDTPDMIRAKGAAKIIRDELEKLPMQGATAEIKTAADQARSLAKYEKDLQNEKSPIYNKIYTKLKDNKLTPDNFNSSYLINSNNKDLKSYINLIHDDPIAMQNMKAGVINHIRTEATKSGQFSAKKYNDILNDLAANKKLEMIFAPEEISKLKNFGEVADAAFTLPPAHHVNTSNTAIALQAAKKREGQEKAGNLVAGMIDLKTGLPVASTVNKLSKSAEAKAAEANAEEKIVKKFEFGAGISSDSSRKQLLTKKLPAATAKKAAYGVGANMMPVTTNLVNLLSLGKEQK